MPPRVFGLSELLRTRLAWMLQSVRFIRCCHNLSLLLTKLCASASRSWGVAELTIWDVGAETESAAKLNPLKKKRNKAATPGRKLAARPLPAVNMSFIIPAHQGRLERKG